MAYETGTVTGHLNLLTALRDFLTTNAELVSLNQNWVVLKEEDVTKYTGRHPQGVSYFANFDDFHDLYLKGPGLAQQDQIHVNICTLTSSFYGAHNWILAGATGYESALDFEDQPGYSNIGNYPPLAVLTNAAMQYWLVGNGRRFILVYKVEGNFFCIHGGLILPYGKPSEFPYAMLLGGHVDSIISTPATASLTNFYKHTATSYASQFRRPEGLWQKVQFAASSAVAVWPYAYSTSVNNLQQNPDGSYTLLPLILHTYSGTKQLYGEVQGLFFVCKRGLTDLASQDTITIGGSTYLVFQNIGDQSDNSYACLLLE